MIAQIPYLISIAILGLILILREHQNAIIQKGLIDRLLVSQGHNPLPDIEPIADLTGESKKSEIAEKIDDALAKIKRMKTQGSPVRFNIPGMPRAGMGEVKK